MEIIDLNEYHQSVRTHMGPLSGMFDMVFKKQVNDMGLGEKASPKQVDELSDRVSSAMEFFAGSRMKTTIKRVMKTELRKRAPTYFEERYGF